jgi:hypothetical protein
MLIGRLLDDRWSKNVMNKMEMVWCMGSFLDESAVDVKAVAR